MHRSVRYLDSQLTGVDIFYFRRVTAKGLAKGLGGQAGCANVEIRWFLAALLLLQHLGDCSRLIGGVHLIEVAACRFPTQVRPGASGHDKHASYQSKLRELFHAYPPIQSCRDKSISRKPIFSSGISLSTSRLTRFVKPARGLGRPQYWQRPQAPNAEG